MASHRAPRSPAQSLARPTATQPQATAQAVGDPAAQKTAGQANAVSGRLQMADIARLAGVSISTVSRALAGNNLVNEQTRRRVAELARSLNYSINAGAQNLRLKQNRTISVVVPLDAATRQHLSDPFFLSLIGSLADALTERGHDMLLSRVDADRLDLAAQSFENGRAAGIVLVGQWHHHDQLNELASRGVPFVVWGAQLPGQAYVTVGSDNVQGGYLATRHLLERSCTRVAFFGDPNLPEVGQRHQGYEQALREAGIQPQAAWVHAVPFEPAAVKREVERCWSEASSHAKASRREPAKFGNADGVDGLFAASDLMAMTIVSTLRRLGRRVPDDVAVVGYDDIELARHFHPGLTSVRQPIEEAGKALVAQLLQRIAGERVQSLHLPTTLEVRESSLRSTGSVLPRSS